MIRVGVLLAAGYSRRFGPTNKLLALFRGAPLATCAANAMRAAELDHRIAVVADPALTPLLEDFTIVPLAEGDMLQSDSLKAGIREAARHRPNRVLFALADMPCVSADLLDRVLRTCSDTHASAVTDGRRRMPPACFPGQQLADFQRLEGDRGAGSLLTALPENQLVSVSAACLGDVDTKADLEALEWL
ncbi:nucleotidyltransferase family protein [Aliiruegeria lutimaris]|uniref:Molybdenum cofactor cytidylyltransferase n=1 Tax=Aliiruegeria lutimaris TaxID=571298 RepID=A0A1G8Q1F9_9RHOB|nr:nucleotidyltransferase family protein [Aliiruegeria lutimaris]SDI98488.1 molybdenum cofactor cytidylyltransferase [Aliiruegeria lutimaris]